MAYLRHHGFPSPLLDWSRSAYVAAYFAFNKAVEASNGRVSIYVFSAIRNRMSGNQMAGGPLQRGKYNATVANRRHQIARGAPLLALFEKWLSDRRYRYRWERHYSMPFAPFSRITLDNPSYNRTKDKNKHRYAGPIHL